MNGYLLDTNVISVLGNRSGPRYASAEGRFRALGVSPVFLPAIALAEIEFGMAKVPRPNPDPKLEELREFFSNYPHLPFDRHTIEPYALLRARIWSKWATTKPSGRGSREKLPEELLDRVTGKELGIDERDLMIASIAAQYTLVLITGDSNPGMQRIDEAGCELLQEGRIRHFCIEFWQL